jgi:hypothetical protein
VLPAPGSKRQSGRWCGQRHDREEDSMVSVDTRYGPFLTVNLIRKLGETSISYMHIYLE